MTTELRNRIAATNTGFEHMLKKKAISKTLMPLILLTS